MTTHSRRESLWSVVESHFRVDRQEALESLDESTKSLSRVGLVQNCSEVSLTGLSQSWRVTLGRMVSRGESLSGALIHQAFDWQRAFQEPHRVPMSSQRALTE